MHVTEDRRNGAGFAGWFGVPGDRVKMFDKNLVYAIVDGEDLDRGSADLSVNFVLPPRLNRMHCTPQQARAGLAESAARCAEMLAEALGGGEGRVEKFRRDGWAQAWPVGLEMLCYMLSHEAHHRGQVCMLAHQLGFPLKNEVASGIWNWEKLWRESGSVGGPGSDS